MILCKVREEKVFEDTNSNYKGQMPLNCQVVWEQRIILKELEYRALFDKLLVNRNICSR